MNINNIGGQASRTNLPVSVILADTEQETRSTQMETDPPPTGARNRRMTVVAVDRNADNARIFSSTFIAGSSRGSNDELSKNSVQTQTATDIGTSFPNQPQYVSNSLQGYGNISPIPFNIPYCNPNLAVASQPKYQTAAPACYCTPCCRSQTVMGSAGGSPQPCVIVYDYSINEAPSKGTIPLYQQQAPVNANYNENYVTAAPPSNVVSWTDPAMARLQARPSQTRKNRPRNCPPWGRQVAPDEQAQVIYRPEDTRHMVMINPSVSPQPCLNDPYIGRTSSNAQQQQVNPEQQVISEQMRTLKREIHYFCRNDCPKIPNSSYVDKSTTVLSDNSPKKIDASSSTKSTKRTESHHSPVSQTFDARMMSQLIPFVSSLVNQDDDDSEDDSDETDEDDDDVVLSEKVSKMLAPLFECLANNPSDLRIFPETDRCRGKRVIRIRCPN